MLTREDKEKISEFVHSQDIDETELKSYHYDRNPYGVEPHLIGCSGCWVFDEEEYYEAQKEEAIEKITEDGACQWLAVGEDAKDEEVIDYIEGL